MSVWTTVIKMKHRGIMLTVRKHDAHDDTFFVWDTGGVGYLTTQTSSGLAATKTAALRTAKAFIAQAEVEYEAQFSPRKRR